MKEISLTQGKVALVDDEDYECVDKTMKNVLVAFYRVPGFGLDFVETPLVGNSVEEHARLNTLIRQKHPKPAGEITRAGAIVENRDAADYIELAPGVTLAQLFPDELTHRKIGRTFFSGAPFDIVLAYQRALGSVSINLRGVLRGDGDIRLAGTISANRLAAELPKLVDDALGKEGRQTKLNIRQAKPV